MALAGLVIAAAGSLSTPTGQLSKLVKDNGGMFAHMITSSITHLITTEAEVQASSYKISKAGEHGAILVTEKWLHECIKAKKRVSETSYAISKAEKAEPSSYFTYDSDFISEAEIKEIQQREEKERENRRLQATQAALQATKAAKPDAKPSVPFVGAFGFGASGAKSSSAATSFGPSSSGSGAATSSLSSSSAGSSNGGSAAGRERRKPLASSKGIAPKVKAWPDADPSRPRFTDDWEVEYFDTLQWTDVKTNHNKYYCLELHIGKDKGKQVVRLYTHYGRTDDLVKNPKAGRRENRFYVTLEQAEDAYAALIEEKTITKGYRKVDLVHSNIGSEKLRALIAEMSSAKASEKKPAGSRQGDSFVDLTPLSPQVSDLVSYIYDEASAALNNTLGPAKITSLGIETPLGVVGLSQIEKGEAILQRLYEMFKLGTQDEDGISDLTNQFYTIIPHNLGRARAQISATRLNSMAAFEEKQDLLQLMRDMLHVTEEGKTLGASDIDMKYRALRARIEVLSPSVDSERFEQVKQLLLRSHPMAPFGDQSNADLIEIKQIYSIHRPAEHAAFNSQRVHANQQILFHGSRISNYVGLLSRGLMMPKMVVAMGGKRRDGGLLGNGIYFGDSAATSAQYCTPGSKGTRLMLLNNVALGNVKDYEQVVFGLMEPPQGYNSVHGVRNVPGRRTDFKDDEYVIFNPAQQYQSYMVEFQLKKELDEFVTSQVFHNEDGTASIQLKTGASAPTAQAVPLAPQSEAKDSISSTVDDIFANLGATTPYASTTTASSRLGGSYKSKYASGATSSTFTTPFSSMLTSGGGTSTSSAGSGVGGALKLQPSTLQTGGLLKPSGLDTTSSLLSGSLKLQPSGLTTSVKVAPLGSSFGRKSSGSPDPYAAAPSNVLKLPDLDPSLQSSTATGAAAVLQTTSSGAQELTEEEKALKRAAMKMGGKNFGSRLPPSSAYAAGSSDTSGYASSSHATSSSYTSTGAYSDTNAYSAPTAYVGVVAKTISYGSSPYSGETDAYAFEPTEIPKPANIQTAVDLPRTASPASDIALEAPVPRKKRTLEEVGVDSASLDGQVPKAKHTKPSSSKLVPSTTNTSKFGAPTPLAATSTGFGTGNWTSSYKATLSSAPLSSSVLGTSSAKPSTTLSASTSLGASFGLGASGLKLGVSVSGLSGSSTSLSGSSLSVPSLRTVFTSATTQAKLSSMLPKDLLKERLAESKLRGLYVTERSNVLLKDYVHLVDLYKKREAMRNSVESEEELKMPKILTRHRFASPVIDASAKHGFGLQYDPLTQADYCVVDMEQFKANYAALTANIFAGLETKNLLFVGDLVVGALYRAPNGAHAGSDVQFANLYREADIEIAICGLEGEAAMKRVNDIFFAVQSATKATSEIIRNKDEIIILSQYPVRNIRIPLRYFKGPAEAIFSRDVDCTCVGFDGSTVWALPRAQRALTKRYNLADFELRHATYEVNLYRWAKRGFAVCVPGYQAHLVTPHLFKQKPWQVTGLAKLLLFEEEMNAKYAPPTAPGVTLTYEPWMPRHQRFPIYTRDEFSLMRIHEFQAKQKLAYPQEKEDIDAIEMDAHCNFFIPWGPQWCNSRVLKHLRFADAQFQRAASSSVGEDGVARNLIFFGIENVKKGISPSSSSSSGSLKPSDVSSLPLAAINDCFVSGAAQWKAVSPADSKNFFLDAVAQSDWYAEAYCVEGSAVEITHALTNYAFAGDAVELNKLVRKVVRPGVDVTRPSSYANGRPALYYLASNGLSDAMALLISKGASPVAADPASGLSPIHFASFSGDASAVETLLRNPLVDINAKTTDQRWTPLHFAAYYGNVSVLQVLLHDTKIRLNPRDSAGRTPVFVAAYAGHLKCLEMLKAAGAKMATTAPPKEATGITAIQVAAQRGHADCRQYLIDLLQPEFPPILVPSAEALEAMNAAERGVSSETSLLRQSQENALAQAKLADPLVVAEWSMVDKAGQNVLHYAVKYAHVALVRQILNEALKKRDSRYPGLDEVVMSPELQPFNLIDIQAENQFGQNALYYALHLLDSFVIGKRLEAGETAGTIEALGVPTSEAARSLRQIIGLLRSAGVSNPKLCHHRALPEHDDALMLSIVQKRAQEAKQTVARVEIAKAKREAELQAEELASRPLARTPIRRKVSNDASNATSSGGRHSPLSSSRSRVHNGYHGAFAAASKMNSGAGFDYSSPSATPAATLSEFASANDTAELLATISQLHKAKQLTDQARAILKTLAIRKERTLYAALKAFQHDRFSLGFAGSLQTIAKLKAPLVN
jgi:poly [ADP-ribose] polymerase